MGPEQFSPGQGHASSTSVAAALGKAFIHVKSPERAQQK